MTTEYRAPSTRKLSGGCATHPAARSTRPQIAVATTKTLPFRSKGDAMANNTDPLCCPGRMASTRRVSVLTAPDQPAHAQLIGHCLRRRRCATEPAEDGTGHEPRTAGIVEVEETADKLASPIET